MKRNIPVSTENRASSIPLKHLSVSHSTGGIKTHTPCSAHIPSASHQQLNCDKCREGESNAFLPQYDAPESFLWFFFFKSKCCTFTLLSGTFLLWILCLCHSQLFLSFFKQPEFIHIFLKALRDFTRAHMHTTQEVLPVQSPADQVKSAEFDCHVPSSVWFRKTGNYFKALK